MIRARIIDFRTLGTAEVEENLGSSVRPIAVQAKRLALLAYVALAGSGRQRRRDKIVALFWPDLDEEHARSALRQALTYLRRTLGAAAVVTRGEEEIPVAPEAVRCDAVLFDEAVAAGRLEDASGPPGLNEDSPPPGRAIAARLTTRLRQAGAEISHDLTPWEGYGWEFAIRSADVTISCILQASDTWLLITRPVRSFADRLRGRDLTNEHEAARLAIDRALTSDPEVRGVRWYTRREFESAASR